MSKSEFFKRDKIKRDYEHYKRGIYRKKRGAAGLNNAEYLKWDHLHNDVEAYTSGRIHMGSIDPNTLEFYKNAVRGRTL